MTDLLRLHFGNVFFLRSVVDICSSLKKLIVLIRFCFQVKDKDFFCALLSIHSIDSRVGAKMWLSPIFLASRRKWTQKSLQTLIAQILWMLWKAKFLFVVAIKWKGPKAKKNYEGNCELKRENFFFSPSRRFLSVVCSSCRHRWMPFFPSSSSLQ